MLPPAVASDEALIGRDARARVGALLTEMEADHAIRILFAVESGSRAWGFPSPDSDYDCRFVYVQRRERYLSLWPPRDVVEAPLDRDLDVNGWDARKAIRLLCKGNAVLLEWLASPLVYRELDGWRDGFLELARSVAPRDAVARHYLHLGFEQTRRHLSSGPMVSQKKIFYALRPAVALRWLQEHPDAIQAPMDLPTLLSECDVPPDVRSFAVDLIERKSATRELGEAPLPGFVRDFLEREFDDARNAFGRPRGTSMHVEQPAADDFFLKLLDELG